MTSEVFLTEGFDRLAFTAAPTPYLTPAFTLAPTPASTPAPTTT